MKVLIAIDSFKGSLSTYDAGEAVSSGIKRAYPDAECTVSPIADGGEGTMEAIASSTGGRIISLSVTGPLGEKVTASYGVTPEGYAVIEMASAAGLPLVPAEKRDPLYTTTYGVGELIRHAIEESGCRRFIVGIGGSATNDGGTGMLTALGFKFLKKGGDPIHLGAIGLAELDSIDVSSAHPALAECEFSVASDVKNPLCGELGCSAVYGPQKGATPESIRDMDAWLSSYARLTKAALGHSYSDHPGAGAAGGLGFAFLSYLGARLSPGIDLVIERTGLEEKIKDSDVVITGEGRLDGQSCMGKAPVGVAAIAKKHGKPVIAFSGCVTENAREVNSHGIDAFFPILKTPCSLGEAMDTENAKRNLSDTAEQAFRLIKAFKERG